MTDAFDLYNNTGDDIICANGTVSANSFVSISAIAAVAWAQDPIVQVNVIASKLGVSVYGIDLGFSFQSPADFWLQRVTSGVVVY